MVAQNPAARHRLPAMDALALLRLQMEWGADEALEDAPVDRLRVSEPPRLARRAPAPVVVPASAVPAPAVDLEAVTTLEALREAIAAFDGCPLRATASNLVFADGNPAAGLLIVGEAPSAAEDRSGRAFDGQLGGYLERMLASIALNRGHALLTPLIPWRPPGGRPPTTGEIAACLPFLHRLIALTSPRRLVLLGTLSHRTILGTAPRRRSRGWLAATVPDRSEPLPTLALPSLDLLLAKPEARREVWAGLRLLRRAVDNEPVEA